jgi:hypothetical protein
MYRFEPPRKFRNKPTTLGGLTFSSKAEARRYGELSLLQRAGLITNIVVQPKFHIGVNGYHICDYIADFSYQENGTEVVEDVKSHPTKTPEYRLKKKLMQAVHGIEVKEIETGKAAARKAPAIKSKRVSRA